MTLFIVQTDPSLKTNSSYLELFLFQLNLLLYTGLGFSKNIFILIVISIMTMMPDKTQDSISFSIVSKNMNKK